MTSRPTGIIRTLPSLAYGTSEDNVGFKRYTRSIRELRDECAARIQNAFVDHRRTLYLLIEGEIRVRLNIVEYVPGTAEICWDSTIRQPKYWAVCSGPVARPPVPIKRKGFQGFRYTEALW